MTEPLLTSKQAAKLLCITVATLANWTHLKKGPKFYKLGGGRMGKRRYRQSDIDAYIESCAVEIDPHSCHERNCVRCFLQNQPEEL